VQSQVGSSLWQVDPYFKVEFLLLVRVVLYIYILLHEDTQYLRCGGDVGPPN
jgi:hypothetical protein